MLFKAELSKEIRDKMSISDDLNGNRNLFLIFSQTS